MAKPLPVTVGTYWINDYKKPPRCGAPTPTSRGLTQTNFCDALAWGFMGAMHYRGHQPKVNRSEGAASPRHWRRATDGDPNGVDTVDFAFLATHGGTNGDKQNGRWVHWVSATFNSHDGCGVYTVEVGADGNPLVPLVPAMKLGDGSLRWVVLDLCRSLQVGLQNDEKLDPNSPRGNLLRHATPGGTWTRCHAGVHIIFGFTGTTSDAAWTHDRGALFGRRAGAGDPLAESWIDEAHSHWCDDAPVAVAWGRSPKDADRRLKAESLSHPEPTLAPADVGGCSWLGRV